MVSDRVATGLRLPNLRRLVLLLNGLFLTGMGGAFALFDLWAYYLGGGPLGQYMHNLPYTIGFFEAHGLACILGLLLLRARNLDPSPIWHLVAAAIHLLLGSANLLFWTLAVQWNAVTPEIVVTAIHGLFLVAQLACYLGVGKRSFSDAASISAANTGGPRQP